MDGMLQRKEAFKEGLTGFLVVGGIVLFVIGAILSFMFATAGVHTSVLTRDPSSGAIGSSGDTGLLPISFGVMGFGFFAILGGLVYGVSQHRSRNSGLQTTHANAQVVAKYAVNRQQDLLTQSWEWDYDDARFYVRMRIDQNNVLEFETSRPVFEAAGEGTRGQAVTQGMWLGAYTAHIGAGIYDEDDDRKPQVRNDY